MENPALQIQFHWDLTRTPFSRSSCCISLFLVKLGGPGFTFNVYLASPVPFSYHLYDDCRPDVLGGSRELSLPLYQSYHDCILTYELKQINGPFASAVQPQRQAFTMDDRRFSGIAGFYDENKHASTSSLARKMRKNLSFFINSLLCSSASWVM